MTPSRPPTDPFLLMEVGWHVGNPDASPLPSAWPAPAAFASRHGDAYVVVGPSRGTSASAFEPESGFTEFTDACAAAGVPVRVGRWTVPGRPRAILVDGSAFGPRRDALLAQLWNAHGVDSLFGSADYAERVLFGHAAGVAARQWVAAPGHPAGRPVAVFHDWSACAGLLYLAEHAPEVGTVLAVHGTVLGRSLTLSGRSAAEARDRSEARGLAGPLGLRAEHSLETASAREADALATLAAHDDAERILGRRADVSLSARGTDADPTVPFAAVFRAALARAEARTEGRLASPSAAPRASALPAALQPLERVVRNYAWTWDPEAPALLETLSPAAWRASGHDPARLLAIASEDELAARAADREFVAAVARTAARLDAYLAATPTPPPLASPVAYLSAEFAVHESLATYSGGLGVLAGDHLRSASDLGVPLVAVGLVYRKGRQVQQLAPNGDQVLTATAFDPAGTPLEAVLGADGRPLELRVDVAERPVLVRAWRARVGRVDLHLLDTDVEGNRPEDRAIAHVLYPSDPEARLKKEVVLGRGGLRLLARLGIEPAVMHLNEGHPAFAALEWVAWRIQSQGETFEEAVASVRERTVFTTHTPVPAGHDRFPEHLIRTYLADLPEALEVGWDRILALGRDGGPLPAFNMTRLALSLSARANAVSRMHRDVSRRLLAPAWPGVPEERAPVEAVTNGVHLATWTHPDVARLLGAAGRRVTGDDFARAAPNLDPGALWDVRKRLRRRFLHRVRERQERRHAEEGGAAAAFERRVAGLDEGALLVGFARRFAAYKRADLLLRDVARLEKILSRASRPVRVFFAGKAHPADGEGQAILRRVVDATRAGPLAGRVFFLDDYAMDLARLLVHGVDVWLNTPRRGLEASGTSGMKVAANGGLNVSVLDGWWPEAFDGTNGWAIGLAERALDDASEDVADAEALYRLLEDEVVPLFFERDEDGVPRRWLDRVKRSLATIPPRFNTDRMVREYVSWAYAPASAAETPV